MVFLSASDVNVTGLERVLNAENPVAQRLIWAVLVLAATGFLGYHAHDRISYYLSYPKAVNIEEIPQENLDFPSVTFGNENWLPNRTRNSPFQRKLFRLFTEGIMNATFTEEEMKGFQDPDFLFTFSHHLEDMLQLCLFSGRPCGTQDFQKVITDYCPAYGFNSNGTKKVHVFGPNSGLQMVIDVETDLYLRMRHQREAILVTLTTPGDQPFIALNAISVEPGKITDIIVKKTRSEYLPPLCTHNPPTLKYFPTYTQQNCLAECMFDWTYEDPAPTPPKCKCYLQMYGLHERKRASDLCNTNNYQQCLMKMHRYAPEQCVSKCPRACTHTVYSSQVQSTNMIEGLYYTYFHGVRWTKQVDWHYFRRNMAYVRVYYQDLTYTDIKQDYAYSFLTLLSDLGGCLGLFLGGCMLTVLQMADLAVVLLLAYLHQKTKNKVHRLKVNEVGNNIR